MKRSILTALVNIALAVYLLGCNSTGASRAAAMQALTRQPDRPIVNITAKEITVRGSETDPAIVQVFDTKALLQMPDNSGVWVSAINAVSRIVGYGVFGWIADSAISGSGGGNTVVGDSAINGIGPTP
jgi:hypothetical protein